MPIPLRTKIQKEKIYKKNYTSLDKVRIIAELKLVQKKKEVWEKYKSMVPIDTFNKWWRKSQNDYVIKLDRKISDLASDSEKSVKSN